MKPTPVDLASEFPDKPVNAAPDLYVIGQTSKPTPMTVYNAQVVVAGRAYQQHWQRWELLQVLAALGIDHRVDGA